MDLYKFQWVDSFVYLGSEINSQNVISPEIKRRIAMANRCSYSLSRHFRSRFLSRRTKISLYKTIVRPVLTYGSEAWAVTKADEKRLLAFEWGILRRIYGPIKVGEVWRRRKNRELYSLFKDDDVAQVIKLGRLRWAGHLARMHINEIPKKVVTEDIHGVRRVGRPNVRWLDGVAEASRTLLGVRDWRTAAQDRANWRRLLEAAQTR